MAGENETTKILVSGVAVFGLLWAIAGVFIKLYFGRLKDDNKRFEENFTKLFEGRETNRLEIEKVHGDFKELEGKFETLRETCLRHRKKR